MSLLNPEPYFDATKRIRLTPSTAYGRPLKGLLKSASSYHIADASSSRLETGLETFPLLPHFSGASA